MTLLFDLTGRRAAVTGGGSGLGLEMAKALHAAGAEVVLIGRDRTKLEAATAALGDRAELRSCDVTNRAAITEMTDTLGRVDILINNAGIQRRAPFVETGDADWDAMLATHLTAPFLLARALAVGMIDRGGGKIINTLSLMADFGRPTIVPYTAAKGGLRMLTRGLASELGRHKIQVNGIAPGYFDTEMNRALVEDANFDAWVRHRTPAGRWGKPEEIAGATVFLASGASDYVSGQILFVDGGLSASV